MLNEKSQATMIIDGMNEKLRGKTVKNVSIIIYVNDLGKNILSFTDEMNLNL